MRAARPIHSRGQRNIANHSHVQFVLIGEASHGTDDFYRMRGDITRMLIQERGFNAGAAGGQVQWANAARGRSVVYGWVVTPVQHAGVSCGSWPVGQGPRHASGRGMGEGIGKRAACCKHQTGLRGCSGGQSLGQLRLLPMLIDLTAARHKSCPALPHYPTPPYPPCPTLLLCSPPNCPNSPPHPPSP